MYAHAQLSEELAIHYVSKGRGRPLVFIPGWTMTTRVFRRNLEPLAERFRAVAYDPRSQGKSSRVESGNHYTQHGKDLKEFIGALDLEDVVLLGWSTGALACYAYFEQFGCDNVSAFVSVDMAPKPVKDDESDWGIAPRAQVRAMQASVTAPDQTAMARRAAQTMYLTQGADEAFVEEIVAGSAQTPAHIAALLLGDGNLCDYSEIAREVAAGLPVLQIVNQRDAQAAAKWVDANTAGVELHAFGGHMMFWEFPDRFNSLIADFLGKHLDG